MKTVIVGEPKVVTIERNNFDSHEYQNSKKSTKDWSIQNDDTDVRSIALTELDLNKVLLVKMLKGKKHINGETKLKCLKASNYIRLDANILFTLLENQQLIPESWKTYDIFFDGTVIRGSDGRLCVLYLYWYEGEWRWDDRWLHEFYGRHSPSAVLKS
jgi:hypothetical protein